MQPGATVEVDRAPGEDGGDPEVRITITAPKRKREAVGVGAKAGEADGESAGELPSGSTDLPDEPEVLPEAPDAPPAADAAADDKPE
jgi:hypothetical protein